MTDSMVETAQVRCRLWWVAAAGGGVLLGLVDLLLQRNLPYPWANLANSSAVWAVAAFTAARLLRIGPVRAAAAGAILLIVAVQAYYASATVLLHDSPAVMWAPSTLLWMVFGLLAGATFGAAGPLSARPGARWRGIAAAMPGAVLLAEALLLWHTGRAQRPDAPVTAAIEAALGITLVVLTTRGTTVLVQALAATCVLAPLCFGLFLTAGFGA
ncbi:DUF6518 family protein [Krasilnikovia sp. MM14-A1259]|uniref:DUF6518 family protein n=1 Tax=Krasilnikovia sp. MM14-A1259 TaxID=3373539 RepID=UPI00399D32D4